MSVPAAPTRPANQRRYSTRTVLLARRMYGDGNAWTPTQIARYLANEHGINVHVHTVRLWVIPVEAEQQRASNRASYHRRKKRVSAPRPQSPLDPVALRVRIHQLRDAGLSFDDCASLLAVDHGVVVTGEDVRSWLRSKRPFSPLWYRRFGASEPSTCNDDQGAAA